MFGRIYQLLPAVVAGVLGVATARAEAGYLPQAGPVSLRFRVPPPPVAEHVISPMILAPLAPIALPTPPMPSEPPKTSNAAPANEAPVKVIQPVPITNGPALEFDARDPVAGPAPAAAQDGIVSPQMLIKYFTTPANTPTSATSAGVVTPIGFTPPTVTTAATTPPPASKPKQAGSP